VNANDRALEIIDERGVPVFQMVKLTRRHLRVDGLFRTRNAVLLLGFGGPYIQPILGDKANSYAPPTDFLPKIFLYPSWQHPGETVQPQPPRPACPANSQGIAAISDGLTYPAPTIH
jgi:hypothetical protein